MTPSTEDSRAARSAPRGTSNGTLSFASVFFARTIRCAIVRAKKTLAKDKVPFEVPRGADLAARLSSVLGVIYLIFNEIGRASCRERAVEPGRRGVSGRCSE